MRKHARVRFVQGLTAAAICWGTTTAGCIPFAGREFRQVAGPAFQSGVTQIVNGVLDGLFAVVEPDAGNANR